MDSGMWRDPKEFFSDKKGAARGIAEAITRAEQGVMTDEDAEILRSALVGLAPSSSTYKRAAAALRGGQSRGESLIPESAGGIREMLNLPQSPVGARNVGSGVGAIDFAGGDYTGLGISDIPGQTRERGDPWGLPFGADPTPARASDMTGRPEFGELGKMMGSQGVADNDPNNVLESGWIDTPQGYSFSETPLATRQMILQDPRLLMNLINEHQGSGDATASLMGPYLEAARAFTAMGMTPRGRPGDTLESGPASTTYALADIEDFMGKFNEPGMQFLDPDALMEEIIRRSSNTDLASQTNQYGQPLGIDEQIELTISAVMSSSPFMTPETQAGISSRLQQAALEYKTALAKGELDISFPKYLQEIGIGDWLG